MNLIRTAGCSLSMTLLLTIVCPSVRAITPQQDQELIRTALIHGCQALVARDTAGMMAPFTTTDTDELTIFDMSLPRSKNYSQLKQSDTEFASMLKGEPICQYLSVHPVILGPDAAYSWSVMQAGGILKNGQKFEMIIRSTDVWRKAEHRWRIVHEHNSFPVDMTTGKADLQSKP